jgi:hypothetical protein
MRSRCLASRCDLIVEIIDITAASEITKYPISKSPKAGPEKLTHFNESKARKRLRGYSTISANIHPCPQKAPTDNHGSCDRNLFQELDLALIGGPPGIKDYGAPARRAPLEWALNHLKAGGTVFMDDAYRPAEQSIRNPHYEMRQTECRIWYSEQSSPRRKLCNGCCSTSVQDKAPAPRQHRR